MSTTTWPTKGAKSGEQPWQDDKSDITPRAGLPVLASGGADPAGPAIFAALARLGYPTPITRGENPVGVIGPEELAAVRQFRSDYGVQEDPDAIVGDPADVVGPWTAEAILRADESATRADAGPDAGDEQQGAELDELREHAGDLETRVGKLEELEAAVGKLVEDLDGRVGKLEELEAAVGKLVEDLDGRVGKLEAAGDTPPSVEAAGDTPPSDTPPSSARAKK